MKKYNRIFTIVIDSLGIGAMEDAKQYGDIDVDTLGHIAESVESLNIPNLQKMGIANLHKIKHVESVENPLGYQMKLKEASVGKDTMTGHWEMMGLHITKPFKTFTDTGFPKELLDQLEAKTGHKIVGNKSASGTEILDELGEHQMKTGDMIVYTSADSVLQICGHEETFGLDELYRCCEIAREMTLKDEWKVGRVIARPFTGEVGSFKRTSNRRDYALDPFNKTMLEYLKESGKEVAAVGKIEDIYNKKGVTLAVHTKNNMDGVDKTLEYMDTVKEGLIFTNLVDFDMLYGHRNDAKGYGKAIEEFNDRLQEIYAKMTDEDMLILTADHGCDPTTASTDHSREYIPILVYGKNLKGNVNLGTRETFADIGKTILDFFNVENELVGKSFLNDIRK